MSALRECLDELLPEWQAAVEEAHFDERALRLYPFPGNRSESGYVAFYFTPGQSTFRAPSSLTRWAARSRTRTAIWIDTGSPRG